MIKINPTIIKISIIIFGDPSDSMSPNLKMKKSATQIATTSQPCQEAGRITIPLLLNQILFITLLFPARSKADHPSEKFCFHLTHSFGAHGIIGMFFEFFHIIPLVSQFPILETITAVLLRFPSPRIFTKRH